MKLTRPISAAVGNDEIKQFQSQRDHSIFVTLAHMDIKVLVAAVNVVLSKLNLKTLKTDQHCDIVQKAFLRGGDIFD